jgi:hypothetical protein
MKLKLTRNERDMIHVSTLITLTFTLIAGAIVGLALGLS